MPLLAAQFRKDAPAKSGGKGKPCGESHIQKSKNCTIGQAAIAKNSPDKWGGENLSAAETGFKSFIKSQGADPAKIGANSPLAKALGEQYDKKQGKPSKAKNRKAAKTERDKYLKQQGRANLAIGAAYLGIAAVSLKTIQNQKSAYNLKFGGNEALTPLSKPIGKAPDIKLGPQIGAASAFGKVFQATDSKGTPLVVKIPNKGEGGGMGMTAGMRAQGYNKKAIDNIRTSQGVITKQEANAAKLAGEKGFGPKIRYADKDRMVMEMAKGQALMGQTKGPMGTNLSIEQKKSVIGAMAKMHSSGMAHNDLHSGNIFMERGGQASFIDWGTATNGGAAVASEWTRMQNRPRMGLAEAGGMGFNLRSVTPADTRYTERKIKRIIGKRIGSLTEVDIQRAIKKNPNLNDQLQEAVNEYYNSVFNMNRTDAMDNTVELTAGFIREDACWKGHIQKGTKRKGNRVVPNCVPVGKAKAEVKSKTGQDGEDKLTKTKRKVWAEGF